MASFNRVVLMGNITRDIDLRYTPSSKAVVEIGLAVNERRKSASGEWVEEATFVDVTLWGRTAEICAEYLSKGSPVLIEGRLKLDQWDDKQTGQKRSKLGVTLEGFQFLDSRGEGGGGGAHADQGNAPAASAGSSAAAASLPEDDDVPF